MADDLEITVSAPDADGLYKAEIFCPAFVDHRTCADVDEALVWARGRLEGTDPFEDHDA